MSNATIENVESLGEALLDFSSIADLESWLNQNQRSIASPKSRSIPSTFSIEQLQSLQFVRANATRSQLENT